MIPLDAQAKVYRLMEGSGDAIEAPGYYTSHFYTCPHANEFSGSKRKDGA
jgi:hypothetical protein